MFALFCLAQIKGGAAGDDLALELDIFLEHLLECENARHTVDKRQHDRTERDLHLRVRKQLVEHDLRISILFQINDNAHTLTTGMVNDVTDTLDAFFICQLNDGFDKI